MSKYFILSFLIITLVIDSCVSRFDFDSSTSATQLVVEGFITDEPGPYYVKLTRSRQVLDFTPTKSVSALKVIILDDGGNSETLTESSPGFFQTNPSGIRGTMGRSYHVRIETRDGKIYESLPEKITPAGLINKIYKTFEEVESETGPPKYQFKIFMDSDGNPTGENSLQWKFDAIYRVITKPELRSESFGQGSIPSPRSCSGYVYTTPNRLGGELVQVDTCSCCTCWAKIVNSLPKISTNQVISSGSYKGIEMGVVPIEYWPFFDKVLVEVRQLSISPLVLAYWKTVADQKEGGTSLFQPAIGKAHSNIQHLNGSDEVQGLFYAAGVNKKTFFIDANDVPFGSSIIPAAPAPIAESCLLAFPGSTNTRPEGWK